MTKKFHSIFPCRLCAVVGTCTYGGGGTRPCSRGRSDILNGIGIIFWTAIKIFP